MDPVQLYPVAGIGSTSRLMIDQIELVSEIDELQADWEDAGNYELDSITINLELFFDDLRRLVGAL